MRSITVNFEACSGTWKKEDNYIINMLRKHYDVKVSEHPQYLFYSVFSFDEYPKHLNYDCIKIFFTGENLVPDFNFCDYAWGFEYLTYGDRYIRFPNYAVERYRNDNELMLSRHIDVEDKIKDKNKFCSFVYSHGSGDPFREGLFREICKYKKVDAGGKYLNNTGLKSGCRNKLMFEKTHKFSIACENSSHLGYTTEKLIQSFAAETIPIYWGDPGVSLMFNEKAFINVHAYESMEQLLTRVREIDQDDALYREILSQPAVLHNENTYTYYNQQLEQFLCHIINQPYQKAFRRNRIFKGEEYLAHHRNMETKAEKYRKFENIWKQVWFFCNKVYKF